jgi:hypothetical protein
MGGFYKIQFDFYGFSCYLFCSFVLPHSVKSSQRAALLPVARVTVTSNPHIDEKRSIINQSTLRHVASLTPHTQSLSIND